MKDITLVVTSGLISATHLLIIGNWFHLIWDTVQLHIALHG